MFVRIVEGVAMSNSLLMVTHLGVYGLCEVLPNQSDGAPSTVDSFGFEMMAACRRRP